MIENNLHNDPFFDAFKEAFNDYQPDFNGDDLKADWSGVKSHINPPQGASLNNPQIPKGFKSLLNLKNVIITSVTGVAIVASTVIVVNKQKVNENDSSITKTTINQSSDNPGKNITITDSQHTKENNTINYDNALKENIKNQPVQRNNAGVSANQNTTNYQLPIPAVIVNNNQKVTNITDQQKTEPTVNQNIPRIIVTDNSYPKQNEIYVSDTQFCQNQVIRVSYNLKDPGNQKLFVSLQGKELSDNNNGFTYKFMKPGWYNLALTIQNYAATISKLYRIQVVASPVALFNFSLNESPMIKFYNQSKYADNFRWQFGDNSSANNDNPYHRYLDTGIYKILLIAASDGVCADTIQKYIHVQSLAEPQIPNTFSPNNDGINDEFYVKIENESTYELTIFDRNSTLVFSSKDKNEKWNGNYKDNNKQCPAGTYFFFLNYKMVGQDQLVVKTGTITLFR